MILKNLLNFYARTTFFSIYPVGIFPIAVILDYSTGSPKYQSL